MHVFIDKNACGRSVLESRMIRKGLARGLLALLMLPGAALALGLGDIRLNSALNAPLDAEIELVNALPEDLSTLEAKTVWTGRRFSTPSPFARAARPMVGTCCSCGLPRLSLSRF